MDFCTWLQIATSELVKSTSPKRDAEILLEHVTGKSRTWMYTFSKTGLTEAQTKKLENLLTRRKIGEPIAYLTGEREFWSLSLCVSPVTLIPRPETECLVEETLKRLPSGYCHILDLGTGTGAIALAIASERSNCQVTAVDIIPSAVQLAKCNVKRLKIQNVKIEQSSWFQNLHGQFFDVIVSNPPYVSEHDLHLFQGDVCFEPRTALVSAENGLSDIRHIVTVSRQYLHIGGWLIIEHGWSQADSVRELFIESNFSNVETYRDYSGHDRLTIGQWI